MTEGAKMKLSELEPRWIADLGAPEGVKQGVSFTCPHCKTVRLGVFFDRPICGSPPAYLVFDGAARAEAEHLADTHLGSILWKRISGEQFADLTLAPSIDASAFGHWHGFITNGEVL